MTAAQANTAIADENRDGAQRRPAWPEGFTYQPPIESMCPCGTKHTGSSYLCPICQREDNQR